MTSPAPGVVACVAFVAACGTTADSDPGARPHASSSTIVLSPDERSVWLTSPDDDAVVEVDAQTLTERRRVMVAGAPEQLAWAGDVLVVTLAQSSSVAFVDATGAVTQAPVPCGGTRAVAVVGDRAFVSCPSDDRVVVLDVATRTLVTTFGAPDRPTSLAVAGDLLAVTASRTGRVRLVDRHDGALVEERALAPRPGIAASQLDALIATPGGDVVAAFQQVDHDTDRARPPEKGGYGSVFDGEPRIAPRLLAPCADRYARFDGGARVFSGPSALAYDAARGRLLVAHAYTDNVAVLDCHLAPRDRPRLAMRAREAALVAHFRVGRGPRGLALSGDGRTAWVDAGFDQAVSRLHVDANDAAPVQEAAATRRREPGATRLSRAGMRGRALFHDAVDTHLTPSGVVTCATCHPAGGEDGLVWFLHTRTVPRKVRRTPPAWNAGPTQLPLHWDGEFADGATLSRATIVGLMEGDGLLVDTGAIAAYMAENTPPPPPPVADEDAPRVARGRALFESPEVGCAHCHAGEHQSDEARHDVLEPSRDPDADLRDAVTPSLRAVRARPPYLHDGRAATLLDVLTAHNRTDRHGHTTHLTPDDVAAMVAYLRTL